MATARKLTDDGFPTGVTVDEFLAWCKGRPGRFELHNGAVVAMAPERIGHVRIKSRVQQALQSAIKRAGLECEALADGIAVHVSEMRWYQPDALVYCGATASADEVKIENPSIVVEVLSPSTTHIDEGAKLIGYFSMPSVQHYLIIDPDGLPLVHHQRQSDDTILARIVGTGTLKLDPPGIEIDVADLFI